GMVIPLLYGVIFYDFEVNLNLWLVVLIPSISISFALLGLFIGIWVKSLNLIQLAVNALLFVTLLASPVFMPPDALPLPLQVLSYFLPMTYAAAALRDSLIGNFDTAFYLNTTIFILATLITLF